MAANSSANVSSATEPAVLLARDVSQAERGATMFGCNLLIVHNRTYQALSDWQDVARRMAIRAPDIEVRILSEELPRDPYLETWQVSRPSLVVSGRPLEGYVPQGGAVVCGGGIGKLAEYERLAAAGVPVPETWEMEDFLANPPDIDDTAFLIVKPNARGRGIDIKLMTVPQVRARGREMIPGPGRRAIVQPFIDHTLADGRPANFRVLTLFGRILYCMQYSWPKVRDPLDWIAAEGSAIASNYMDGAVRDILGPPDVLALAQKAAEAFPDRPILGIDIIRENVTGQLFVLEVNTGGRVWHLSSDRVRSVTDEDYRAKLYAQFDALSVASDALIENTRALAR
jgi:hypothetical protein